MKDKMPDPVFPEELKERRATKTGVDLEVSLKTWDKIAGLSAILEMPPEEVIEAALKAFTESIRKGVK